MKKNENGYGLNVVKGLLVLGVVVTVGLVGWFVWTKQNGEVVLDTSEDDTLLCDTQIESQKSWKLVMSSEQSFSMCVPGGWTLLSDTDANRFGVVPPFKIEADKDAVVENLVMGGKDGVTWDQFQVFEAINNYQGWTDEAKAQKDSFVLNDGTEGTRYYTKHVNVGEGIGPVEGEEDYEYLFEKNGKFIHAVYTIHPGTEKQLETIESVLKTLVIN